MPSNHQPGLRTLTLEFGTHRPGDSRRSSTNLSNGTTFKHDSNATMDGSQPSGLPASTSAAPRGSADPAHNATAPSAPQPSRQPLLISEPRMAVQEGRGASCSSHGPLYGPAKAIGPSFAGPRTTGNKRFSSLPLSISTLKTRSLSECEADSPVSPTRHRSGVFAAEITLTLLIAATFGLGLLFPNLRPPMSHAPAAPSFLGGQGAAVIPDHPSLIPQRTNSSFPDDGFIPRLLPRAITGAPNFYTTAVWPAPNPATATTMSNSTGYRTFNTLCIRPLRVVVDSVSGAAPAASYLRDAVARADSRMRALVPIPAGTPAVRLCVAVTLGSPSLSAWDASEAYSILIPAVGDIAITADSAVGIVRALSTLTQLIATNAVNSVPGIDSPLAWAVRPAAIRNDRPAYPWRGVMIDTARHFFPLSDLRRTIDGMEVSKMNRLHLHLIDSQSFPLKWPGMDGQGTLWQLGAFKDAQGNPQAYSAAELADLVDYGRRRGVEVYPELTMPGHADVFNLVYPEIMSCNPDMSRPSGQLQPLVDRTYDVLENLFAWGMDQAFASSPAWHIGSDEVHKWCWNWNNIVANYDFLTAYKRFQTFVSDQVVSQRDRLMVTWEDLVTPSSLEGSGLNYETIGDDGTVVPPMASKKMVVQAWRSIDTYNWLIAKGYETLFSVSDWWYFTCGQWCTPGTGSRSMTTAYNAPIPATGSAPANFKGGEAAFWSEETYSGVLDKVVWPRSGAVAERLWTNGNAALSGQLCTETRTDRLNRQLTSVGIAPWPASTVMN